MKQESQFVKRLKSLLWRAGMMAIAFFVQFLLENLKVLELDPTLTTVIGLGLGEVSKWLNTKA